MSARLESGVKERLQSPTPDQEVTLIVGVEDVTSDAIIDEVESTGATVEERLPCDYLAVSTFEQHLEDLCSLDAVTSVEIEGKGTVLTAGNF